MRFIESLSNEDILFEQAIYEFCKKNIQPLSHHKTLPEQTLRDLWRSMGEMGLHGITLTESDGGLGLGYKHHAMAMFAMSQSSAGIALSYGAHSNLCISQIARIANANQKKRWLPKLIRGEHIDALAITEPQAGSDARAIALTATPINGGYLLNGGKIWITNGPLADIIIIYAKTKSDQISTFVIETPCNGLSRSKPVEKMGMTISPTGELNFQDCFVHEDHLIGEEGEGTYHMMAGLDYERILLAAGPLGIHQACYDLAKSYSQQRHQFGKPIASHQMIQAKLADIYTQLNAGICYLTHACQLADQGRLSRELAASVILFTSENATKAALETIQILGGNGYSCAYPAERFLRDAKLYEIGAGTNEIRRILIGRCLTKPHHQRSTVNKEQLDTV